jgi:hypothetical protein
MVYEITLRVVCLKRSSVDLKWWYGLYLFIIPTVLLPHFSLIYSIEEGERRKVTRGCTLNEIFDSFNGGC